MEEDAARCQIKGVVILRTPPTDEEGGGNPKKVTQCKRVKFGGRRADSRRQYNTRRVQLRVYPAIENCVYHEAAHYVFCALRVAWNNAHHEPSETF